MLEATENLKICIIGAGMGGLTCALALAKKGFRDIEVFELASNLGFVGAGIQLAPNMARILDRLGAWAEVEQEAVVIKDTSIRQGASDTELAHVELDYVQNAYGYPHMVGHRSSLAGALYNGCKREKSIRFNFGTVAGTVISFSPKPTFIATPRKGGEAYTVEADVLLAADGVKSKTRVEMLSQLGVDAQVKDTKQSAYRIMLSREQMSPDPELLALIDSDRITRWIGERRHIIAYPVSSKNIYNISTAQPDVNFAAAPSETYTTKGSKSAMLSVYADFCPTVQRMLNLVPEGEVCEWKLRVHEPLPTWVHGSVALVGDACHPTLPHLNQGAAQAIEDAAVLGEVLARIPDDERSPQGINKALRVYERVRKQRAETIVEMAAASGRTLHLGEGKAREERDRIFQASKSGKSEKSEGAAAASDRMPDKWADRDVQKMVFGFDCMKVAGEVFDADFKSM